MFELKNLHREQKYSTTTAKTDTIELNAIKKSTEKMCVCTKTWIDCVSDTEEKNQNKKLSTNTLIQFYSIHSNSIHNATIGYLFFLFLHFFHSFLFILFAFAVGCFSICHCMSAYFHLYVLKYIVMSTMLALVCVWFVWFGIFI